MKKVLNENLKRRNNYSIEEYIKRVTAFRNKTAKLMVEASNGHYSEDNDILCYIDLKAYYNKGYTPEMVLYEDAYESGKFNGEATAKANEARSTIE